MSRHTMALATALAVTLLVPLAGCGRSETRDEHARRLNGERLAKIAKVSGGNWDKLSDDERQFIVNNIAHGNEQTARMLILSPDRLKQQFAAGFRR